MISTLLDLSFSDDLALTGLSNAPLLGTGRLDEETFRRCIDLVLGRRNWTLVAEEALDASNDAAALNAFVRAGTGGEQVPDALRGKLEDRWSTLLTEMQALRTRALDLPSSRKAGSFAGDVARIEASVQAQPQLSPALPPDLATVEIGFQAREELSRLAEDSRDIREFALEESQEQLRGLADAFRKAATTLSEPQLLESALGDLESSHLLTALRVLPELLANYELDLLKRLSVPGALEDEDVLREIVGRARPVASPPPPPRANVLSLASATASPPVRLAAVSEALFATEKGAPRGFESRRDYAKAVDQLRLVASDDELGARWMRLAKAPSQGDLGRLALGHALAAFGRAYLDRQQFRLATELFRDALVALALPEEWFEQTVFNEAVIGLVASRAWPRMSRGRAEDAPMRPSDVLVRPDIMFDWIRRTGANGLMAELWADLPDGADSRFLEALELRFTAAAEIRFACAEAALTAHRFRARPAATFRRVRELLGDRTISAEIEEALRVCETEFSAGAVSLRASARREVSEAAEKIAQGLARADTGQPLATAVGRQLSDLLIRLASGVSTTSAAPKLNVAPLVGVFYPREQTDAVFLPIRVSNDKTGGLAPEFSLQVVYEGPRGKGAPKLEPGDLQIPPLDADEDEIVRVLLSFPRDAAEHQPVWPFRATLLRGTDVFQQWGFTVDVRERPQPRANPFSAGQSVNEDELFVGRETEMRDLKDIFVGDRNDVTPLVVGLRRVGKTSLVKHLLRDREIRSRFLTHYWDMEDTSLTCTTAEFLIEFAERVRAQLPPVEAVRVPLRRDEFRERPYSAFERFCDAVEKARLQKPVIIVLDEFDRLIKVAREGERRAAAMDRPLRPDEVLQPETFGALRKMLMNQRAVRLVLCGLPDILKGATYDHRLFGLLRNVTVGPFTPDEADRVMEEARPAVELVPLVRAHLRDASGLQPYLLHLLCNHLYARMLSSGRDQATPLDVVEVIERDIVPNQRAFADYEGLIEKQDWHLLRALALAQKSVIKRRRYVTPAEVLRELQKAGHAEVSVEAVSDRLRQLASATGRPLVQESGNYRGNFRLVIGLLGEHLIARTV